MPLYCPIGIKPLSVFLQQVYYRLHVSIVKFTVNHLKEPESIPYEMFDKYLSESASGPFALQSEKRRDTYVHYMFSTILH